MLSAVPRAQPLPEVLPDHDVLIFLVTREARAMGSQSLSAPSCGNFHPGNIPLAGLAPCAATALTVGSGNMGTRLQWMDVPINQKSIQGKSQEINQTLLSPESWAVVLRKHMEINKLRD